MERVGGLQTQWSPSGYISLWSRLRDFDRSALTLALERRRVVQATLVRTTIHMTSVRAFWLFSAAVGGWRRRQWLQATRSRMPGREYARAAEVLRGLLAEGPRRQRDLVAALTAAGFARETFNGARLWLDLVRIPPSGTWDRPRADLYGLAEQWLGPGPSASEAEALPHLVRRYLRAYGPATLTDVASWTGVPLATLRPMLEQLRLRRYRDDGGGELLDVPGAPLPHPDIPAPVRFIAPWDAMLLAHARRTGVLPERHRSRVFNAQTPQSVSTFLVDGMVAGAWRVDDGRVRLKPFEPLSTATRGRARRRGRPAGPAVPVVHRRGAPACLPGPVAELQQCDSRREPEYALAVAVSGTPI
ncbi:MAG: winged helix DNA-binding domain-containing protein [Actinomycetota bacterium]